MRRYVVLLSLLVLVLAVSATTAFAGSANIGGTIVTTDPTMQVVFISTPNCTGQGASPVLYKAYPFTVDADGTYNFSVTSDGGFASMYLFEGSFNPAAAFPTCIAGSNSGNPVVFSEALTAGTTYYWVVFDDTFAQVGGNYSGTVDGPGNITIIGSSVACPYPLPAGSVVYNVPAGAPAFFAADLGSQTSFDLPAGTWYISEFTGDFAKVWIACQASPVYIPANAVAR